MDLKKVIGDYLNKNYQIGKKIIWIDLPGKNNADLVPIRIHNEETFRGHLMITFMATAILQVLQQEIIKKKKKNDKTNPEGAFMVLRNQKCKVYDKNIIPQEPVKEINDIYKLLKIDLPKSISREDLL